MNIEQIISSELIKLINELKQKHNDLGMKATGRWLDSLDYEVDGYNGKILGEYYTEQLTKGREHGKRPPITPIENWVKAKFGLSGKQATSMAFAVAHKIGKSGTTWFEKGGSDLLDGVLTDERIRKMITNVGMEITMELAKEMKRELISI